MLEHLSIYTSFFFSSSYFFIFFFITFSISMYIMCVCLFSALGSRVDALQISIIIIIIIIPQGSKNIQKEYISGTH